jgi:hypothetical protein
MRLCHFPTLHVSNNARLCTEPPNRSLNFTAITGADGHESARGDFLLRAIPEQVLGRLLKGAGGDDGDSATPAAAIERPPVQIGPHNRLVKTKRIRPAGRIFLSPL